MEKIKIGVIGVGNMGKNHIRLALELNSIYDLVGVYDVNPERIRQIGYQGRIFNNVDSLLEAVDAVVIAVPSALHKDLALRAAQVGVHALVEKPLALSCNDARVINSAYENIDRVLMVGHVERFNPVVLELEKILDNEKIVAISIERCSPADLRISDTDVVYDLMIHDIDILINALNKSEAKRINAIGRTVYNEKNVDYAQSFITFENNILASVAASRTTEKKIRLVKIHCNDSFIEADLLHKTIMIYRKTKYKLDVGYSPLYRQESVVEEVFVPNTESLKNELMHFAMCIRKEAVCKTSGNASIKSLSVLDNIKDMIYS